MIEQRTIALLSGGIDSATAACIAIEAAVAESIPPENNAIVVCSIIIFVFKSNEAKSHLDRWLEYT
mgnify:CR=1 FL=1